MSSSSSSGSSSSSSSVSSGSSPVSLEAWPGGLPESWGALPDQVSFQQEFLAAMEEGWRDPRFADLDDAALSAAVRGQAAEVAAATCRWLLLLGEAVRRGVWAKDGARTPAQWLSHWCSIASPTAREHVRVALRLALFPETAERFARGELSYSKVRAITRLCEPALEGLLLQFAANSTGDHLERIVGEVSRQLRGERRRRATPWERREVSWRDDGEGMMVITARLPYDQGAEVVQVLQADADRAVTEAHRAARALDDGEDGEGGASSGELWGGDRVAGVEPTDDGEEEVAGPDPWALTVAQARADALLAAARTAAKGMPADTSGADRHLVVYHADVGQLPEPDDVAGRERRVPVAASAGVRVPAMSVRTLERLACDGRVAWAVHDQRGDADRCLVAGGSDPGTHPAGGVGAGWRGVPVPGLPDPPLAALPSRRASRGRWPVHDGQPGHVVRPPSPVRARPSGGRSLTTARATSSSVRPAGHRSRRCGRRRAWTRMRRWHETVPPGSTRPDQTRCTPAGTANGRATTTASS